MLLPKYTTLEFTEKAQSVHGDLYDYSLVDYVHSATKVTIVCLKHGNFTQVPPSHLNGRGCAKCGDRKKGGKNRSNAADFTKKAQSVHGDLYDYSLVDYVNCHKKVKIICKIHGVFEQTPSRHNCGSGCQECGATSSNAARTSNTQDCIKKFRAIHGDLYDYSLVEYVVARKKVKIICKIHGKFDQNLSNHLLGNGCPKCAACHNTGEKHYQWNFELTDEEREQKRRLHLQELTFWRKSVFVRDNYTCQKCHEPSGKLNAHHILPWSKYPNERFEVDNGVTLCGVCHRKYHSTYKLDRCDRASMNAYLASNPVREVALSV